MRLLVRYDSRIKRLVKDHGNRFNALYPLLIITNFSLKTSYDGDGVTPIEIESALANEPSGNRRCFCWRISFSCNKCYVISFFI